MRALVLSAVLFAATSPVAHAQTAATAQPAAALVKLTAKEVAALQAQLTSLDRQMGKAWVAEMTLRESGPGYTSSNNIKTFEMAPRTTSQLSNSVSALVRSGKIVVMDPVSERHRELQVERLAVEKKLLDDGQKVRNMSNVAKARLGLPIRDLPTR